ncbi:hypothetical protein [Agromyces aerolatus]|uniref:hypothetical protein n=1 Tax=Agromyces sp. LY-1074 TaxID=3074080 RepID=UPI002862172B|nr:MULTISPECIES: hypothetical protein [unclassified Agromyces]MDR5700084.1 hypothetical protein [Agromyces sp. LY-1074]MDR5706548.1 hypothetical protein [Agromyces sp. LY-1358]
MSLASAETLATRFDRVGELQSRIRGMEARRLDSKAVPTHPALAAVLPGGSLREGTVVQAAGSTSLLMSLLAGPSAAGRWTAVVGLPDFGVEAAARSGIALERLVLVPDPGRQWLTVTAALADVIPVVAVQPVGRLSPAETSRFTARLRQRGGVLITTGEWPGADSVLEVAESEWHGLEPGHGALAQREVVVRAAGRAGLGRPVSTRLRLPDRSLGVAIAPERPAASGPASPEPASLEPASLEPASLEPARTGEVTHVDFRRAG